MGKRELVALLSSSFWYPVIVVLVIVVWLFLAVPWVCLQLVIVVFPDHTFCELMTPLLQSIEVGLSVCISIDGYKDHHQWYENKETEQV